jgi:hypothetical protein
VAACVSLASLVSCSDSDRHTSPSAQSPSLTDPLAGKSLSIEPVLLPAEDVGVTIKRTIDELTQRCMEGLGYEYIAYPYESEGSPVDVHFRYGYLDPSSVLEFGYATMPSSAESQLEDEIKSIDDRAFTLGDDYISALWGSEAIEGCHPKAVVEIYGDVGGLYSLSNYQQLLDLQIISNERLYSEGDGMVANREWSECMKARGYDFSGWFDAHIVYSRGQETPTRASSAELRQAGADAACRGQTDLEARLLAAENGILDELLEQNQALVEGFTSDIARVHGYAVALLEEIVQSRNGKKVP